jgi:hypothetical protein
MDDQTKGAWLLAQSKSLDAVSGVGRLENIQYAGRIGRLYNLLRRTSQDGRTPVVNAETVTDICRLNNIDRASRELGLKTLHQEGRIDVATSGDVAVIGATTAGVLEATAQIFESAKPSMEERAVVDLSEKVAEKPEARSVVAQQISDEHKISARDMESLIEVCRSAAILDQSEDRGFQILFNSNTFRDARYASKAYSLMQALTSAERSVLSELQDKIKQRGAVSDIEATKILGDDLYRRLVGVGLFDRLEVSNSTEAVGYLTSPDAFQKYGKPFEDDPVDDAKALLASLTYGMTRSDAARGSIAWPDALLRHLIEGSSVGGQHGVRAIAEDYKELEKRQVVQLANKGGGRCTMRLLKKDVGELARALIRGNNVATDALLLDGSAATNFRGPSETRHIVRERHTLQDKIFVTGALDRLRSGG